LLLRALPIRVPSAENRSVYLQAGSAPWTTFLCSACWNLTEEVRQRHRMFRATIEGWEISSGVMMGWLLRLVIDGRPPLQGRGSRQREKRPEGTPTWESDVMRLRESVSCTVLFPYLFCCYLILLVPECCISVNLPFSDCCNVAFVSECFLVSDIWRRFWLLLPGGVSGVWTLNHAPVHYDWATRIEVAWRHADESRQKGYF